jgi:hypothetical protein
MRAGRAAVAVLVTVVAAPIGLWCALVAAANFISQILAQFGVIANADWARLFDPAVWFGFNNVAGNGSIWDSLFGGPGAPGGTVGRYFAAMITAMIAIACWGALSAVWRWARAASEA